MATIAINPMTPTRCALLDCSQLTSDKYLRDQHEMNLAIGLLLSSELFTYYRERMVGIMMGDAQEVSWTACDFELTARTRTRTSCTSGTTSF